MLARAQLICTAADFKQSCVKIFYLDTAPFFIFINIRAITHSRFAFVIPYSVKSFVQHWFNIDFKIEILVVCFCKLIWFIMFSQYNNCLSKYRRLLTDLWPFYHFDQEESRGHAESWPVLPAHRTPDAPLQPLHHDNVQCAFWGLYAAHSPSRLMLAEWKLSINKTHTNNPCVQPHDGFFSPNMLNLCLI